VNPQRLLDGENPETSYLEDADHWLSVYTELLQTKAAMVAALNERLTRTTEELARREMGDTDVVVLEQELQRFQSRIDFWKQRKVELESNSEGASPQPR
jgi:hypothetical protein